MPTGASTGRYEALELRDSDPKRFLGKGVLKAVSNVNQTLGPAVIGLDPTKQFDVDKKLLSLDSADNKANMGANAILSVSMAVAKAAAASQGFPLYRWINELAKAVKAVSSDKIQRIPTPVFNMINGGLHGAGNLDFQEFQIIPASTKPYSVALKSSVEVYHQLKDSLIRRGAIHSVGDEGGFAPNLFMNADALEINLEAINQSGYQIGQDFFMGLDVAADTFYKDGMYSIRDSATPMNSASLISFLEGLNEKYRLTYLEDPLHEDDWQGWTEITSKMGKKLLVVGDDLLATNPNRVKRAIEEKACNAALIKPNQIGTVSETLEVIKLCRDASWQIVISHRSGETNDWFIADFAVGVAATYVKFGAPARGERVAKYNRLLSIEEELAQRK